MAEQRAVPLLTLQDAAFGYGGRTVVSGVQLAVHPGDFTGIVGPNGAGKTTLFRGILGLIRPLAGHVQRGATRIGYVPQRETLDAAYPLTLEELVQMGAYGRLRGARHLSRADRALARACLERVGLVGREREAFAGLSGGERQRALIARALMVRPGLLLLDEPTSGVDRGAERRILELLLELNLRERLAVLLVSHQIALVRSSVASVLWVEGGRVAQGPPAAMLAPERLDALFGPAAVAAEAP